MNRIRPYTAAFFAFVLGPWIGCFYLGRGWLSLIYLALAIILTVVSQVLTGEPGLLMFLALHLAGAAHCFYLARQDRTP